MGVASAPSSVSTQPRPRTGSSPTRTPPRLPRPAPAGSPQPRPNQTHAPKEASRGTFPGATWRPINTLYLPNKALVVHNRMSVHISAGNGSPWGFFDQPQRASSQFFVYKTGAIEQFMDS